VTAATGDGLPRRARVTSSGAAGSNEKWYELERMSAVDYDDVVDVRANGRLGKYTSPDQWVAARLSAYCRGGMCAIL
jgi:hypothetical protein